MRLFLVAASVLACTTTARADDGVVVGGAVGAGGQGGGEYGALELRLDALWRGVRIGIGGRAVWEDGGVRTREWSRAVDAISLLRLFEVQAGPVAIAAGALAPTTLGRIADGTRQALDDRARTGVRVALTTGGEQPVEGSASIDDVLDPALVGGAVAWGMLRSALVVDPQTGRLAVEAGVARRWERDDARLELGGSAVGERWRDGMDTRHAGLGVTGYASGAIDRAGARWSATVDARAGNGSNGAAFGPLYRAERAGAMPILDAAEGGVGGGLALGVASPSGWLSVGGRARPGLGAQGVIAAGAPMRRAVQAGGWLAISERATAGAAELRVAWARYVYSSVQLARMYVDDLAPAYSATIWFGALSN